VCLDEPTSGLDPLGRRLVREIIRDLKSRGTTIFLNSHLLSEVEITCDRVSFVKHGQVVRTSPLKSLLDGLLWVEIRTAGFADPVLDGLRRWSSDVRAEERVITMGLEDESGLPDIHRFLVQAGVDVYSVTPKAASLEDLFVEIIGTDGGL
jgi:ABC-2 type transport system ATP-binding protein